MNPQIFVHLHKLSLFSNCKYDVKYPFENVPGHRYQGTFSPQECDKEDRDTRQVICKYHNVSQYWNEEMKSRLLICNMRVKKGNYHNVSPLYVIFYPNHDNEICYSAVCEVEKFLMKYCKNRLGVSVVHLAVDVWETERDKLFERMKSILRPGNKRYKYKKGRESFKEYERWLAFGSLASSNTLCLYDKAEHMRSKMDINVPDWMEIVRIESRLKPTRIHRLNIRTIDQLADYDWSFLYGRYFSLHEHTRKLDNKLSSIGVDLNQPIWKIKDIMAGHFKVTSSNFYRDYLKDHSTYSERVRDALSRYHWCADYRRYQS